MRVPNVLQANFAKYPRVNSARLSTTCGIASKYSVYGAIIAKTKLLPANFVKFRQNSYLYVAPQVGLM